MSPAKIDHDHDLAQAWDAYAASMLDLGLTDSHQDATDELVETQRSDYEREGYQLHQLNR